MSQPRQVRLGAPVGAILLFLAVCSGSGTVRAQTIDDGVMMPRGSLCTGFLYGHDSWTDYWEGTLKRDNGNIGKLTTQNLTWMGSYGIVGRLNVIAEVPFVWTNASQGVLHSMSGMQDMTLAAKYRLLESAFTSAGSLRAIAVVAGSAPLSNYTPDFQPLSIGLHSKQVSGRMTLDFEAERGWFLLGTAAYTWRGNVTLDRPAYFTDNQLFLTDQVAMADVFDYTIRAGYVRRGLQIPVSFSEQRTLGGGDIRRQDMPFVSNRMDFSKLDAFVMYSLPPAQRLAVRVMASYTLSGRNVGQSTTLSAGLLYTFHF